MSEPVNYDRLFAAPPPRNSVPRIENNACRQVLRLRDIPQGRVAKAVGLSVSDPLTFRHLADGAGFLAAPSVTDVPPPPPEKILVGFERTPLWAAWVAAWDERPMVPSDARALVTEGVGWGRMVLHADLDALRERSGILLHAGRTRLVLEMLKPWAESIWTKCDPDSR